jgi:crotonobetainyl-CoA:carnitine CoA-transferase CaiB-like acyl-CoA transferase
MHRFPPHVGGQSAAWALLNQHKRVVTADLKSPADVEALRPLLARADVLIEQFRPGVMDRLGLGYAAVSALNPRLVYCSITGYGQTGPRALEAGHDVNYQALTGLLSQSPGTHAAPSLPPSLTADIAGGSMPAVLNILLALRDRDRTGRGCHLDVAMADAMFTFAWYGLATGHAGGRFPGRAETMLTGGSPRYRLYATADERFLAVGALEDKFWFVFAEAAGLDPALRSPAAEPAAVMAALEALIRARPAAEWAAIVGPLDCCVTVVASLEEALADPHFRQRGLFDRTVDVAGTTMPAIPLPIAPGLRRD